MALTELGLFAVPHVLHLLHQHLLIQLSVDVLVGHLLCPARPEILKELGLQGPDVLHKLLTLLADLFRRLLGIGDQRQVLGQFLQQGLHLFLHLPASLVEPGFDGRRLLHLEGRHRRYQRWLHLHDAQVGATPLYREARKALLVLVLNGLDGVDGRHALALPLCMEILDGRDFALHLIDLPLQRVSLKHHLFRQLDGLRRVELLLSLHLLQQRRNGRLSGVALGLFYGLHGVLVQCLALVLAVASLHSFQRLLHRLQAGLNQLVLRLELRLLLGLPLNAAPQLRDGRWLLNASIPQLLLLALHKQHLLLQLLALPAPLLEEELLLLGDHDVGVAEQKLPDPLALQNGCIDEICHSLAFVLASVERHLRLLLRFIHPLRQSIHHRLHSFVMVLGRVILQGQGSRQARVPGHHAMQKLQLLAQKLLHANSVQLLQNVPDLRSHDVGAPEDAARLARFVHLLLHLLLLGILWCRGCGPRATRRWGGRIGPLPEDGGNQRGTCQDDHGCRLLLCALHIQTFVPARLVQLLFLMNLRSHVAGGCPAWKVLLKLPLHASSGLLQRVHDGLTGPGEVFIHLRRLICRVLRVVVQVPAGGRL
mmetsp:Transcript_51206/g.122666  ORF Transcript_51206/g.122666 Transcript_51206/m.122666 type:complete len:594 (+) Transcript_51206:1455-3236(+)